MPMIRIKRNKVFLIFWNKRQRTLNFDLFLLPIMQLTYFTYLKPFLLLFLSVSILFFYSCSDEWGEDEFVANDYLNHVEEYSASYQNCELYSDNCTYISISYPVFDVENGDEGMDKIAEHIQSLVIGENELNAEDVCEKFIDEYANFVNDTSINEDGYNLAWYDNRNAEFISIQKKVISVKTSTSNFYGGAHPNSYVYLRNYDPVSGDSIGLEMIFNEDALNELSNLAEHIFRKSKNISKNTSLDSEGYWFEDDHFELTPNFAFTDQGLWFYYNDYEIAPYSMGESEIIVPYSIIMHLFD
jgi:hypothetical protein